MNTKEAWSKINEIAEEMLEDKDKCDGCVFFQYFSCSDGYFNGSICCNEWKDPYMRPDPSEKNTRPKDCPIKGRNITEDMKICYYCKHYGKSNNDDHGDCYLTQEVMLDEETCEKWEYKN